MTPETRSYFKQTRNLLPRIAAALKADARMQRDPLRHIQLTCYAEHVSNMADVLAEVENFMEGPIWD